MKRETIEGILADLYAGRPVYMNPAEFTSINAEALAGNEHIDSYYMDVISASLTSADIPTFERALRAIDEHDLAWLGFKLVYDPALAVSNTDNEVTKKFGEQGSASGEPLVFFCNDAKEVVCAHEYSGRDLMQMKDVTRGPAMHNYQFEGLFWEAEPLFEAKHVWLLGASDVASELAKLAKHVGFQVTVCDYDPAYLSEERFPEAHRILFGGGDFADLANYHALPTDYVCVLTRGHMFDPVSCAWATSHNVHYVGMMGCKGKNETVHDLYLGYGGTEEGWEHIKRPIGIKFGAKTPAELAISIVAELIDVRYHENYSEAARAKHESHLD